MRTKTRWLLAVGALLPLLLVGCSDDGEEASGDAPAVVMEDFQFDPSSLDVEPGSTVTVELSNEGDTEHSFTIDDLNVDEELEPGDSTEVDVEVPDDVDAKGIPWYCRYHPTQMKGTLTPA